MEKMIRVECVSKRVGEARLLSGINLELYGGQICGIVGRTGSGKSVLLKCICGFMSVTEGEILQGTKRIGTDIPFIEDTGFIIEAPAFLPGKSGFRNLEYPSVIILDEPMNGLDNEGVREMRKLFLQLKSEGKALLIVSHNREDIEVLCDTVYTMDRGYLQKVTA